MANFTVGEFELISGLRLAEAIRHYRSRIQQMLGVLPDLAGTVAVVEYAFRVGTPEFNAATVYNQAKLSFSPALPE